MFIVHYVYRLACSFCAFQQKKTVKIRSIYFTSMLTHYAMLTYFHSN
jgi:hypothetical protein